MDESILKSVKLALGLDESDTSFDSDILMHINGVFSTLNQLGVGPAAGYSIAGASETWANLLGNDPLFNNVKSYVYIRVRLLFDPPATSYLIASFKEQAQELEWRINQQREGMVASVTVPVSTIDLEDM